MRKNTQNEHIIVHFEYVFTCHYSKTVWLAEKPFLVSSKNFLILRKGLEKKHFFVSLRLPSFSPIYIALKLNQKIITKISNYLTENVS